MNSILLCLFSTTALAARRIDPSSSFPLYAYGTRHGGLPLFGANGFVYAGDYSQSNATDATALQFRAPADGQASLVAEPNNTSSAGKQWYLCKPDPSKADDNIIGLSTSTTVANGSTSGFRLYGNSLMYSGNGVLEANWYITPAAGRTFALRWGAEGGSDGDATTLPVALRAVEPSIYRAVANTASNVVDTGVVTQQD